MVVSAETVGTGVKGFLGNASGWEGAVNGEGNSSAMLPVGVCQSRGVAGRKYGSGGVAVGVYVLGVL